MRNIETINTNPLDKNMSARGNYTVELFNADGSLDKRVDSKNIVFDKTLLDTSALAYFNGLLRFDKNYNTGNYITNNSDVDSTSPSLVSRRNLMETSGSISLDFPKTLYLQNYDGVENNDDMVIKGESLGYAHRNNTTAFGDDFGYLNIDESVVKYNKIKLVYNFPPESCNGIFNSVYLGNGNSDRYVGFNTIPRTNASRRVVRFNDKKYSDRYLSNTINTYNIGGDIIPSESSIPIKIGENYVNSSSMSDYGMVNLKDYFVTVAEYDRSYCVVCIDKSGVLPGKDVSSNIPLGYGSSNFFMIGTGENNFIACATLPSNQKNGSEYSVYECTVNSDMSVTANPVAYICSEDFGYMYMGSMCISYDDTVIVTSNDPTVGMVLDIINKTVTTLKSPNVYDSHRRRISFGGHQSYNDTLVIDKFTKSDMLSLGAIINSVGNNYNQFEVSAKMQPFSHTRLPAPITKDSSQFMKITYVCDIEYDFDKELKGEV